MNTADNIHPIVLTSDELILLRGLVSNYRRMMLLDLRRGGLADHGAATYRTEADEAGKLIEKLGGPI